VASGVYGLFFRKTGHKRISHFLDFFWVLAERAVVLGLFSGKQAINS